MYSAYTLNKQGDNIALTPTSNAEEAEVEWFYEDIQDLLELIPKKDVFSLYEVGATCGALCYLLAPLLSLGLPKWC